MVSRFDHCKEMGGNGLREVILGFSLPPTCDRAKFGIALRNHFPDRSRAMNSRARLAVIFSSMAMVFFAVATVAQESSQGKGKTGNQESNKLDPAAVRKLVEQLKSSDFKIRNQASQELSKLQEVPDVLREAARTGDLETQRRAQAAIKIITDRLEEKAFQAMVADLQKVELDRFIRRMITDEKFAGDKQWQIVQTIAKAATRKANELAGQKYEIPEIDMKALPLANLAVDRVAFSKKRILVSDPKISMTSVQGCVMLCTGRTPRINGLRNSILIVDGDFAGATVIDNSLIIVRGNVGRVTVVRRSIILATGNFEGATGCDHSFLQVNNRDIRFTGSEQSVLVKTVPKTTGPTTSRTLEIDKGPLQLIKFSTRKPDDQLVWGKEVNGLAVAIATTDRPDKFLVRWKNVGTDKLDLRWVRFHSDIVDKNRDDLLDHVFLKGADGKFAPTRKYPAPRAGGLTRSVILGPGKTHEEEIDLWSYVERPAAAGRYDLWIEPDISSSRFRREPDAKSWTGKIQSNKLAIMIGK
jgi:hypothetical protein